MPSRLADGRRGEVRLGLVKESGRDSVAEGVVTLQFPDTEIIDALVSGSRTVPNIVYVIME